MPEVTPPAIPPCEPWGLTELLDKEKEVVGIYLSAHPLDGFRFEMDNYGFNPIADIESNKGKTVRIAGFVSDAGHMVTKMGKKFGKFSINDYSGNLEIALWENKYVQYGNFLDNGQKLMIQGVWQEHKYRPGVMEFDIQNIMLLESVRKTMTKRLSILIPLEKLDGKLVANLVDNVKQYPGNTDICFSFRDEEEQWLVKLKTHHQKVMLNDDLIHFLQAHEGDLQYAVETT